MRVKLKNKQIGDGVRTPPPGALKERPITAWGSWPHAVRAPRAYIPNFPKALKG
ncbi:hypothetical protein CHISP_0308 [Chitinispirillum alkaliphilum]|nr:hypothetical protein CHISP_0308 [Chitinispirillum alkaliphilum]